jgi:hypothetical protein
MAADWVDPALLWAHAKRLQWPLVTSKIEYERHTGAA